MSKIIYWSKITELSNIDLEPKQMLPFLYKTQVNGKGNNFISCPAITTKHRNTFMTTIPYDINVKFLNDEMFATDTKINQRVGLYENSYSFSWDIQRIFFSEDPQIMEVTPTFLHRTSYSQQGHAPSGAFDIGKWFRPSSPTFQLWSNEDTFQAKRGEPHLYFNFPNKEKVVLREFRMSEKLYEIMYICLNHKNEKPKQQLESIYDMFNKNGLHKKTIKEIKNNLIAPEL